MDMLLIQLIVMGITGAIAAAIANSKGRNAFGWFFAGFFIGLIGIIIVAVLPNLNEQRHKDARIERENRRLREQLRQERIKGETFRQHTSARLDTHDQHLGLDTRSGHAQLEAGTQAHASLENLARASTATSPGSEWAEDPDQDLRQTANTEWYYDAGGQMKGPVPEMDIFQLIRTGRLDASTLVWAGHLSDWTPLGQVEPFRISVQ